MSTGLPVHVNAWFEVSSRGDALVGIGDGAGAAAGREEQVRQEWNRELCHCVVEAYVDLLAALPSVFAREPQRMYRAWPRAGPMTPALRPLVHRPLFLALAPLPLFVLPSGQLGKMSAGVFRPDATSDSLHLLFRQLFPMFACPPALADEFRAAGVHEVSEVSAERVRAALRKDDKVLAQCGAILARDSPDASEGVRGPRFIAFIVDTLEFVLSDLRSLYPSTLHPPPCFTPKQGQPSSTWSLLRVHMTHTKACGPQRACGVRHGQHAAGGARAAAAAAAGRHAPPARVRRHHRAAARAAAGARVAAAHGAP